MKYQYRDLNGNFYFSSKAQVTEEDGTLIVTDQERRYLIIRVEPSKTLGMGLFVTFEIEGMPAPQFMDTSPKFMRNYTWVKPIDHLYEILSTRLEEESEDTE